MEDPTPSLVCDHKPEPSSDTPSEEPSHYNEKNDRASKLISRRPIKQSLYWLLHDQDGQDDAIDRAEDERNSSYESKRDTDKTQEPIHQFYAPRA